jgi:hypothetical protein
LAIPRKNPQKILAGFSGLEFFNTINPKWTCSGAGARRCRISWAYVTSCVAEGEAVFRGGRWVLMNKRRLLPARMRHLFGYTSARCDFTAAVRAMHVDLCQGVGRNAPKNGPFLRMS